MPPPSPRPDKPKSVLDAGCSAFNHAGSTNALTQACGLKKVDEAFSTQTCSVCNSRAGPQRPERSWNEGMAVHCVRSGHDRDRQCSSQYPRGGNIAVLQKKSSSLGRGGCQLIRHLSQTNHNSFRRKSYLCFDEKHASCDIDSSIDRINRVVKGAEPVSTVHRKHPCPWRSPCIARRRGDGSHGIRTHDGPAEDAGPLDPAQQDAPRHHRRREKT